MCNSPLRWLAVAAVGILSSASAELILHVDDDARPGGDGVTWETALNDLQNALDVADAVNESQTVDIRVAQGVYRPTVPDGDRTATFQVLDNVALRGGFAGVGEPDPDARDVDLYETILSGDLNADDTGDFNDPSRLDNSHHVLTGSGTDFTATLDGFTIRDGHDERESPDGFGGGLLIEGGSPTVTACTFTRNWATFGGAVSDSFESHASFTFCAFTNNAADLGGALLVFSSSSAVIEDGEFIANAADSGGAMFTQDESDVSISDCHFEANSATDGSGGAIFNGSFFGTQGSLFLTRSEFVGNSTTGNGAGVANFGLAGALVTDCIFADNVGRAFADSSLGSVVLVGSDFFHNIGGGASLGANNSLVADCVFTGNSTDGSGGGILLEEGTMINCTFNSNTADGAGGGVVLEEGSLTNCKFDSNTADIVGGGLSVDGDDIHLINCSFALNQAASFGGGAIYLDGIKADWRLTSCSIAANTTAGAGGGIRMTGTNNTLHVANSVLWGNTDSSGASFESQLRFDEQNVRVDYSCVQGLIDQVSGSGNISADPLLVDSATGDLRLEPNSPCIDAAANTVLPHDSDDLDADVDVLERIPIDLLGAPRFIDIANVPDTGVGAPRVIDMGAYEHSEECNGNGVPDDIDIAQGTSQDCNANGIPDECEPSPDCNGNGTCDDEDIATGTSQDCDRSGVPDECEADCNGNGMHDSCDIAANKSEDCNADGVPDECLNSSVDCDNNGLIDACEIASGTTPDSNNNGRPDGCEPAVVFVDVDAGGWNNGLSWGDAFVDLQDALTVARNSVGLVQEVWVAEGVYAPAPPSFQREQSFILVNNVTVYGGFAGTEDHILQRDVELHPTALSGDLNGDDTGDLLDFTRFENSYHVVQAFGVGAAMDGFIVRAGMAGGGEQGGRADGGGMLVSGSPSFTDCVFEDNLAAHLGGGAHCLGGPIFSDCHFQDNLASRDYGGSFGGGAFCEGACVFVNTTFENNRVFSEFDRIGAAGLVLQGSGIIRYCEFVGNVATSLEDSVFGGALSVAGAPLIENCLFADNTAEEQGFGGAIFVNNLSTAVIRDTLFLRNEAASGGAIDSSRSPAPLSRCTFISNSALGGGAIVSKEEARVFEQCLFVDNTAMVGGAMFLDEGQQITRSCLFNGNHATESGGAVFNRREENQTTFENCTFVHNEADEGGGLYNEVGAHSILHDSILWDNVPDPFVGVNGGHFSISFCDIPGYGPFAGNIDENPQFVDPLGPDGVPGTADDDFRVGPDSPVIDAGDPDFVPAPGETDLDMHARVLCQWVDMGAYEFGIGDADCDRDVDGFDFQRFLNCFTGPDPLEPYSDSCVTADFNADGDVDWQDFAALQRAFTGP